MSAGQGVLASGDPGQLPPTARFTIIRIGEFMSAGVAVCHTGAPST